VNSFPEDPTRANPADGESTEQLHAPSASTPLPPDQIQGSPDILAAVPAEAPRDPAWSGLDVVRLAVLTVVALFVGVFVVLFVARYGVYTHSSIGEIARVPLVIVGGQALAYVLILGYMYVLVTRERHRPDFFTAIHWNWPSSPSVYVVVGAVLSVVLQLLASRLPIPKNLPIDTFFRTPAEAWALTIFGVTLAPLMEEFFFRGFLYPVLARTIGLSAAVFITACAFALLHASQLSNSWGPVLVIFLVGMVLTLVRARKNSVAAGLLIHVAYNGTISTLMFFATDGFRHLEKLNQ
jgi:membrane protease YdiL (CAAX protease family)